MHINLSIRTNQMHDPNMKLFVVLKRIIKKKNLGDLIQVINGYTHCKLYYHPRLNQKDGNGGINFMNIEEVDRTNMEIRFTEGK